MTVKEELIEVIKDYIDVPENDIDTSIGLKSIGLNSYVMLTMVSAIEDRFMISIPDNKLIEFNCLDDIIAYVEAGK